MAEKLKVFSEQKPFTQMATDSARSIWLAGLGAFAKAQTEGGKLFETLVKEGEAIESRTRKTASKQVDEVTKKAAGAWDKLEQVFEDRVAKSLNRLGVPTHKEVRDLSKQVAELNANVKQLLKTRMPATKAKATRTSRSARTH